MCYGTGAAFNVYQAAYSPCRLSTAEALCKAMLSTKAEGMLVADVLHCMISHLQQRQIGRIVVSGHTGPVNCDNSCKVIPSAGAHV